MVICEIQNPLNTIATFCDYLMHPAKIAWALWSATVELSFVICLVICMGSVLLYIVGFKKYAKFAPLSVVAYTIIQCFSSALR